MRVREARRGKGRERSMYKNMFLEHSGSYKCEEIWEYMEEFNIIELTKTWVEKEGWKKIEGRMSKKFKWNCTPAKRESKKGRAKGGIIIAKRVCKR